MKEEKPPRQKAEDMEEVMIHDGPFLRYILASVLWDGGELEECFSEVILRIWQKRALYDPEKGSWKGWIGTIARNTALNWNRNRRPAEPLPETVSDSAPLPEEAVLRKERQKRLEEAVAKLSAGERQLFYRRYYYMQSAAQMAAELGMTERAVEGRLYRMRQKLRKMLGGDGV